MKILAIFLLLTGIACVTCAKKTKRQEWRQMSRKQQQAYLSAVTALKARFPGNYNDFSNWNYDQFAILHYQMQSNNHGKPAFFPWHRIFLIYYEKALRTIDPSITLPWWDWAADASDPLASPLLQPNAFGGDGDPFTHCVTSGVSKGWISVAGPPQILGGCLKRQFSFTSLWPAVAISSMISSAADYDTLFQGIENGPHGALHMQLGGNAGDFAQMWSTNDALFFLHHGMVDKIWWLWQNSCKDFFSMYSGFLSEPLPPFKETVRDALDISSCYHYSISTANEINLDPICSSRPLNPFGGESKSNSSKINRNWLQQSIISLVYQANSVQSIGKIGEITGSSPSDPSPISNSVSSFDSTLPCLQNITALPFKHAKGIGREKLDAIHQLANDAIAAENARRGCSLF